MFDILKGLTVAKGRRREATGDEEFGGKLDREKQIMMRLERTNELIAFWDSCDVVETWPFSLAIMSSFLLSYKKRVSKFDCQRSRVRTCFD